MTVNIYQIKDFENCNYTFMGYEFAAKHGFTMNDYEKVYTYETDENTTLDDIFFIFNMKRPEDFRGHSLSVSDIIEMNGKKYYVDSFGFEEVA